MAIEIINNGEFDNDPNADTLRVAFEKANDNFTDLDGRTSDAETAIDEISDQTDINTIDIGTMAAVLSQLQTTVAKQPLPLICSVDEGTLISGTTTQAITLIKPIPAGSLSDGSLELKVYIEKSFAASGHTCNVTVFFNTLGNLTSGIAGFTPSASTTGTQPLSRVFWIKGNTLYGMSNLSGTANGEIAAAYAPLNLTINRAVTNYIVVALQLGSSAAGVQAVCKGLRVDFIKKI